MALSPEIHRLSSVTSTNSEVARLALTGVGEGVCVVADEQTAGRGRLQRQWFSPHGSGLYFSILLRPVFGFDRWPLLTLMAAVAVHDTLVETCGIEIDIKWPNDILTGGRKLCGILAETIETNKGRAVVLGIGINLTSNALPRDLSASAISAEEAAGKPVSREAILQALLENLTHYYETLHTKDGDSQIVDGWCNRSSYATGRHVCVSVGNETIQGWTRGLEGDGALRVETTDGQINVVRAGDVTAVRASE